MKKQLLLLAGLIILAGHCMAQTMMPLPAHGSVYTGSARGYWFTAPTAFVITGLRVPSESGTGLQYIHVFKCNDPFPIAFGTQSSNFTTLHYTSGAPNGVIQTVSINVAAGDVIGILGTAGTSNSYSVSGVSTSTINGFPVNLTRLGYQGNINTGPAPLYWGEALGSTGQITRVEMYYGSATPVAPGCLLNPLAPSVGSTTVCSGNTLLRWNKATGATGYDVYLNAGTAAPTTIVSANQTDTFYNATTAVGPYRWKIVPRNTVGAATGCAVWSFSTLPGLTPAVTATVSPDDTICQGATAIFTATPSDGGATPSYQWKKNNINVGSNSPIYTDGSLVDNDVIKVIMTSNALGCLTDPSPTSNAITIRVLPSPTTTLNNAGPLAFCNGGSVSLSTTVTGSSYEWKYNGLVIAGANGPAYTAGMNGYYKVRIATAGSRCPTNSDSVLVTVYPTPFPLVNRNGMVLSTETTYDTYQWYFNGAPIPGATASTHTVTRDGRYTVVVKDMSGCDGVSVVTPVNSLSVGEHPTDDITIYPNPATDFVLIDSPIPVNVVIKSVDGKQVMKESQVDRLNIGHLAKGLYLIQLYDNAGKLLKIQKLVKSGN